MRVVAYSVVSVLILALAAGCGGSLGGEEPTATYGPAVKTRLAEANKPERTPQPTSTPRHQSTPRVITPSVARPSEPTKTPFPTATPNPLASEFSRVLLTVDELPTGWSANPQQLDIEPTPTDYICGAEIEDSAVVDIQTDFQKSVTGPYVAQGLSLYRTPEEAELILQDLEAALNSCPPEGFSEEGLTAAISPLSFPEIGDQSFAYRLTVTADELVLEEDVVIARVGKVMMTVSYGGLLGAIDSIDSTKTEQFARTAEEKIRSINELIDSLEIPLQTI